MRKVAFLNLPGPLCVSHPFQALSPGGGNIQILGNSGFLSPVQACVSVPGDHGSKALGKWRSESESSIHLDRALPSCFLPLDMFNCTSTILGGLRGGGAAQGPSLFPFFPLCFPRDWCTGSSFTEILKLSWDLANVGEGNHAVTHWIGIFLPLVWTILPSPGKKGWHWKEWKIALANYVSIQTFVCILCLGFYQGRVRSLVPLSSLLG